MAAPKFSPSISRRPTNKRARGSEGVTIGTRPDDLSDGDIQDLRTMLAINDTLDYPRRRAMIACEICRSRKSRCNGARPKCKLCTELDAECVYREPGIKLDAGDKLILKQLARIEGLIHNHLPRPVAACPGFSPSTSAAGSDEYAPRALAPHTSSTIGTVPLNGLGTWGANINSFPKAHTTPALHLLKWPVIKDLVFRACDPRVLLQLESARTPLFLENSASLDLGAVQPYIQAYFEQVNTWYAIVDPYTWQDYYRTAVAANFGPCPETCVMLLVISLGKAAFSGQSIADVQYERPPGMEYFSEAWELLPNMLIRNDIVTAQCHILAAAYLMYLVRPLEAWNMLYNASMKLQLLLASSTSVPPHYKELSVRVYWNALMIESDLLAELDLPQSGIVQYEDNIRLPRGFPHDAELTSSDAPPPGDDSLWYFLAEIALRRLLNRVSHLIYANERTGPLSVAALEPIVAELDYQLTQWYESLPHPLKFPCGRYATQTDTQTVLRFRYFACRTIIYRPYIQAVLADETAAHEPGVQEACRKCLDACLRQVEDVSAHRAGHLPYLWQGALSVFSQTLLLMAATLSPTLSMLLPPAQETDRIISDVLRQLDRLSHLAPSLQLCAEMLRESEDRRQPLRNLAESC